jgi:hypothetical protein
MKVNRKLVVIFITYLLIILFCNTGLSAKTNYLAIDNYTVFEGKINKEYDIKMYLYCGEEGEIVGNYFYIKEKKKSPLRGHLKGNNIILFEIDNNGEKVGKFSGEINDEKFTGYWLSLIDDQKYVFNLNLTTTLFGSKKSIYAGAGIDNEKEMEKFAKNLKRDILKKDKLGVAKKIAYPVKVEVKGKKIVIEDKDEFIENFDQIFYKEYLQTFKDIRTFNMSFTYKGIMFGKGQMWLNSINSDPKVFVINNYKSYLKFYD